MPPKFGCCEVYVLNLRGGWLGRLPYAGVPEFVSRPSHPQCQPWRRDATLSL